MRTVEELRPLKAGRVLSIWRESREMAEEPLERALLCNARVLAESCFFQGEPVFADAETVLESLSGQEMETLLRRLSGAAGGQENPAFDQRRFEVLMEE